MGIFKLILFVIHFQLAYSNIFSHFAKKFESISPETIEITNLKNMFACFPENSENCARVIQLQILANASFNCYLENIHVKVYTLEIWDPEQHYLGVLLDKESPEREIRPKRDTKEQIIPSPSTSTGAPIYPPASVCNNKVAFSRKRSHDWYFGYVKLQTGQFTDKQNTSSICRRVKRYPINDDWTLVVIDEVVSLKQNKDIDAELFWVFFFSASWRTLFFFQLNLYDEDTDTYCKWNFFQGLIFLTALVTFFGTLTAFLYDLYKRAKALLYKENDQRETKKAPMNSTFKIVPNLPITGERSLQLVENPGVTTRSKNGAKNK